MVREQERKADRNGMESWTKQPKQIKRNSVEDKK